MPFYDGIYYQDHNDCPDNSLPPVVLIHGAGGSHLHWPINLRRLPGRRVLALNLPGHDKSQPDAPDTIGGFAARLHKWRLDLGVNRSILVGHSMGSAIALTMAREYPDHAAGMILLGAAASLRVNPALLEAASRPESFPQAVSVIIRWSYAPEAPAWLIELAARRLAEVPPDRLHADFLACSAFDASDQLAFIHCPTLVLSGEKDKMTPIAGARHLAENIPGASLRIIPAAGHMVMLEQPLLVQAALTDFLANLKR